MKKLTHILFALGLFSLAVPAFAYSTYNSHVVTTSYWCGSYYSSYPCTNTNNYVYQPYYQAYPQSYSTMPYYMGQMYYSNQQYYSNGNYYYANPYAYNNYYQNMYSYGNQYPYTYTCPTGYYLNQNLCYPYSYQQYQNYPVYNYPYHYGY